MPKRRHLAWIGVLLADALFLSACQGKTPTGGLEVVITTSGPQTPANFDAIEVVVKQETSPGAWRQLFDVTHRVPSEITLPTTLAVEAGTSPDQDALIVVAAIANGLPVIQRVVQTQIPTNRVAELLMVLDPRCRGQVSTCPAGQSCQPATGMCGSNVVDSNALPTVLPGSGGGAAAQACSAVAACGGDPTGTWQVTAGCFEFPAPSQCPANLVAAPADAGVPFVFNGSLSFGTPQGILEGGQVTFRPDHTYEVSLGASYDGVAHFPPFCFQAAGLPVSCDALASAISASPPVKSPGCAPASDGGCDCSYTYTPPTPSSSVAVQGQWVRLGSGAIQMDDGDDVAFCATANRLDLTVSGGNGPLRAAYGLHALTLAKTAGSDGGGATTPQSTSVQVPTLAPSLVCPSTSGCGGDPTGPWQGTVCLDAPLPVPPAPPCDNLVYQKGAVTNLELPHGSGTTNFATVRLNPDHTYDIEIQSSQAIPVHFAPYCLTAWGANPSCSDLASAIGEYYVAMPNYRNVVCATATDGGCDCTYGYEAAAADQGSWSVNGTSLTLASEQSPYGPSETVFCKSVAELQIVTAPGSSLVGLGPATMTLTPMLP